MQPNVCAMKKIIVKDDAASPLQPIEDRGSGELEQSEENRRRHMLPQELAEIIWPAIQAGGLMGMSGFVVGGFAGVVRSTSPTLFALASGIQWFTLGSAYWASRGLVIHTWGKEKITSRDKVSASAIAGGVAGTTGGLLRGPRNIIPGALVFALFGAAGQALYNRADSKRLEAAQSSPEKKSSWMDSKWSPFTVLTDETYQKTLQESLLNINAQIGLLDDRIEALRDQDRKAKISENEKPVS